MNEKTAFELRAAMREKEGPTCTNCTEHKATDVHHRNSIHHDNRPENLTCWCKRCHNDHHGISDNLTALTLAAREYADLQKFRIKVGNQVAAYDRLGYDIEQSRDLRDHLKELEQSFLKRISKMLKQEPVYVAYLSKIKGVGPAIAAALLSEIGDPGRFVSISALWSYCGLGVQDGAARKRKKGEKANWNARLRMVTVGRLVPQFIKLKNNPDCFGRRLYDQYKAFYTERDGQTLSLGHVGNRARRKVAKTFLSCLWLAWRRIKGLPESEPYCASHLQHTHIVTPEEWAGDYWDDEVILGRPC